jgi:hypothetical protein
MIRRHLLLATLCVVVLAACGRGSAEVTLGAPIQLAPGDKAVLAAEKIEVEFTGIATDSRCANDVTCVWAGEVVVRLAIRSDGKTSQHEVRESQSARVGDHAVTILQVLPARASSGPIPPADYRVTLKITR